MQIHNKHVRGHANATTADTAPTAPTTPTAPTSIPPYRYRRTAVPLYRCTAPTSIPPYRSHRFTAVPLPPLPPPTPQVTSRRLQLRWGSGGTWLPDGASLKHAFFETSTASTVMTSMLPLAVPEQPVTYDTAGGGGVGGGASTKTGLIFLGKYDTTSCEERAGRVGVVTCGGMD